MAKKVSLPGSQPAGTIVSDTGRVSRDGVNETPGSFRNTNVQVTAANDSSLVPLVDATALVAQDANDGSEDGNQPSFSMPPFANGKRGH